MNARIPTPDVVDSDFGAFQAAQATLERPVDHSRAADHYGHQAALAGNEWIHDDFARVDIVQINGRIAADCIRVGGTDFAATMIVRLQALCRELTGSLNRLNGSSAKPEKRRALFWVRLGDARLLVEAEPADPTDGDRRPWITSAWINDAWVDVDGRFSAFDIAGWQADVMRQIASQREQAAEATWPDREAA